MDIEKMSTQIHFTPGLPLIHLVQYDIRLLRFCQVM